MLEHCQRGFGDGPLLPVPSLLWKKEPLELQMTCNCFTTFFLYASVLGLGRLLSISDTGLLLSIGRYEAGLLFAYLAFVPFSEPGVMDSLSLQVSFVTRSFFYFLLSSPWIIIGSDLRFILFYPFHTPYLLLSHTLLIGNSRWPFQCKLAEAFGKHFPPWSWRYKGVRNLSANIFQHYLLIDISTID